MSDHKHQEERVQLIKGDAPPSYNELLDYKINGRPAFATVSVELKPDQNVISDGGAMMWMDGDMDVSLTCPGGCCAAIGRSCAGESCYFNKYKGPGHVTFGFDTPGDILPFAVTPGNGWILTKGAFIAGSPDLKVSSKYSGCCTGAASGESAFLVKVTTTESFGLFFAGDYGEIIRHEVPPGKKLLVDNGMFFAAHETQKLKLRILGGMKTCCCGGEGLVMEFTGPTVVYTQTRDPAIWDSYAGTGSPADPAFH